jgi:para-nitrobenzyl esterase
MMGRTSTALAMIAVAALAVAQAQSGSAQGSNGPRLVVSANVGIVQTTGGTVQGFVQDRIYTYRGVPYATAERFKEPVPTRWNGVRQALSYGHICPQTVGPQREPQTFISDNRYWPMGEDCQNLNIWSPGIKDGKKRPIMVWLHGGGYFSGSSIDTRVYDGENLSRKGDVVVVSVNHRLNVLGFLDLSGHGAEYRHSGNVGMVDLVAALQWIKANAAAFGGDPENITIFGQSGGGGKVSTLLYAPSAHGLFQKAIVESGVMDPPMPGSNQAAARRVAELTFKAAGVKTGDVAALQALPYDQLAAAGQKALMQASAELTPGGSNPLGFPSINWEPVVDGDFLPARPFSGAASPVSADVPLLIGSTLNEFQLFPNPRFATRAQWGPAEANAWVKERYGANAEQVAGAYRAAYPMMAPRDWPTVDIFSRAGALRAAGEKAAQSAPVYNYLFAWKSNVLDGAWASGHSMELAFVFDNAEAGIQSTGGGREVDRLTDEISRYWINFARTGNPNGTGLPNWPRYTAAAPVTMVLDNVSKARTGYDAKLIALAGGPLPR